VIGVLALQGAVQPHLRALSAHGLDARAVADVGAIGDCNGLVLPGGESTVQRLLVERFALGEALDGLWRAGKPVLATCAGLIVAVQRGWLDARVRRNGYGTQLDSFIATPTAMAADGELGEPQPFIRAPRVQRVGARAEVLARLDGDAVLLRQGAVWAATFHPELTGSAVLHGRVFSASLEAQHPERPWRDLLG